MICYNDREQFRYYNNRREYPMNLTRSDKRFTIATLSHKSRQIWMEKFSQLMKVIVYYYMYILSILSMYEYTIKNIVEYLICLLLIF